MNDWFTVNKIDDDTVMISEYRHPEETHCYLLIGDERCLLIDTGLGIGNICDQVRQLTDKPVTAVATHIHWDHIGGHKYFSDLYVQEKELDWLRGNFPLPLETVKKQVAKDCELPKDLDINSYELFRGEPSKILTDRDIIDIGGRRIEALHTPGHSPGHLCFREKERGYLFTGDLVYKGVLFAYYPSTDPVAYLQSLKRIAALNAESIFPAHHSADIRTEIIHRMVTAFEQLEAEGKLHHGSGKFNYGDWGLRI